MTNPFIRSALLTTFIFLGLSLAACTPKCMINGRVVDAETQQAIKGAAVAIRWYEGQPEINSETPQPFDSAQDISDKDGNFSIPDYPDKNVVIGVYKDGYICWSNRSSFSNGKKAAAVSKDNTHIQNDMVVRLKQLTGGHSLDQHASFTVLVAEEVSASKQSPFYEAIKPLFRRWRENLRQEFKKTFGGHKTPESN